VFDTIVYPGDPRGNHLVHICANMGPS